VIRFALFIVGTIFFVWFSRRALSNPQAHGFYRFFVFEGVMVLLLLNQPYWFREPLTPQHLFSWFLLASSIFLIVKSFTLLKKLGGQAERAAMPENHAFENTAHLVEEGLYRYIRHPMYSSLLFLGWGAFFKHTTFLTLTLIVLVTIFIYMVARVEERENIDFFGVEYAGYRQRTKMFIPYIF